MPERNTVSQIVQIGAETTPGTTVAANRRLQSLMLVPTIEIETNEYRASGFLFPNAVVPARDWTSLGMGGSFATYSELPYIFNSLLRDVAATQIMSADATPVATGAYTWLYQMASGGGDNVRTYTIEYGSSLRASRCAYGLFTQAGLTFSRTEVGLDGALIAHALADGIALTANPTTVDLVPIQPKSVDVFIDNTAAALGTTKLTRVFNVGWNLGGRFNPVWTLNSTLGSFAAHSEGVPDATMTMTVEADAAGMAQLQQLRDGATKFIRIQSVGPRIFTGNPNVDHRLRIDAAIQVSGGSGYDDTDGVVTVNWPLRLVHDATWGRALSVEVINKVAAL